jgi:hypothetical protein
MSGAKDLLKRLSKVGRIREDMSPLVYHLLTASETESVCGGGYAMTGGDYTMSGGDFTQSGGYYSQTGGSYTMSAKTQPK